MSNTIFTNQPQALICTQTPPCWSKALSVAQTPKIQGGHHRERLEGRRRRRRRRVDGVGKDANHVTSLDRHSKTCCLKFTTRKKVSNDEKVGC